MSTLDAADLGLCVRCGLCLSSCPTFRLSGMEGYSPRGRINTLRADLGGPVAADYLDTCLGCRACEAVCPSGVPYGRILEGAREQHRPSGGIHRLIELVLLWIVARRWRLSLVSVPLWVAQRTGIARLVAAAAGRGVLPASLRILSGLPKLRAGNLGLRLSTNYVPPDGVSERGQVVLFAGCVQDAWWRDVHWATIAVLTRLGYRVRVPHGQVCCGALHAHAGRGRWARRLARANLLPLERFEGEIVVNAAGCGAKLKEYGEVLGEDGTAIAARVRDVTELIEPHAVRRLAPTPPPGYSRVGVHDPCHLVHAQGISREPRELLRAAGYELLELRDASRCCGAAGTYALRHRQWAEPLRDDKLEAIADAAPDAVAVANPGCLFWMAAADDAPPMLHPIQLVAMALAAA